MNVMLVSVNLRRREIGVRRAVGATKQDILRQFMVESVMQCIAGEPWASRWGFWWRWRFGRYAIPSGGANMGGGDGVFLSSGVGLFFGIYPALRASQLDPIVALRYDNGDHDACASPGEFSWPRWRRCARPSSLRLDRAGHRPSACPR